VLERARIMRRRKNEVNTRTYRAPSFLIFFFFVALATAVSACGGAERHADRLWRQAVDHADRGDTQGAVDRLQKIIDQYPDAEVADKARAQIVVYRGLLSAAEAYPSRRARELMVQLAREIETFRGENGRVPAALEELVPAKISAVPLDPWRHPFVYEANAGGYTLRCLGADGSPGGAADAADLIVVDGTFAVDRP
jgi:hypothetical protein